ncbi:MAG: hypothetical protein H0V13_07735 [Nocardioidaceae bacterium]|nr:hypothetical protein [Nocardioidaceae bacterium]MBA3990803.1 hypothetical protein [Propionibacteriales bacterium]
MNASVVRDEITAVREKLVAVEQQLRDTFKALNAIPDWLRVGDPDRFARPADRRKAKRADDLRAQAEDLAHEQVVLRSRLDDLDTAISGFPTDSSYGVVLPVRLETRFTRPRPGAAPGSRDARWKLRVRVEPDPIAMPVPPSDPTRREADLVVRCWNDAKGDLSTEAGGRAFQTLGRRVGLARAAWLRRAVPVDRRTGGGFETVEDYPASTTVPPPLVGLPHRLEIWGGPADDPRRLLRLTANRQAIAAQAGLHAVKPMRDGRIPRTWWNSYEAARRVGLAGEIVLGEERPALDVLMCVGLCEPGRKPSPREVFVAHARAGRLGTLPPLSPTNTVAGVPAADTGKDPKAWLEMARLPKTTAGGLSDVLTGDALLTGVLTPDLDRHRAARALVRALWPVLWQRSLKDLAGLGEEIFRLGSYAGRNLHPFGPFPVLRIADLPYGVLPIADYDRMVARGEPLPRLERAVLRAVDHLTPALVAAAGPEPALVGGDEEAILRVLSKVPTAREYGSRSHPATVLMAALIASFGGPSPTETVSAWEEQAALFRELLPVPPARRHSPAFHVEPWPHKTSPEWREVLQRLLDARWEELATKSDGSGFWGGGDELPIHPLARLVRQALLLTMVEAGRLGTLTSPPQPPGYLVPLSEPDRMAVDAQLVDEDGPVFEVPGQTAELVAEGVDRLPRRDAVVHQFEDVRQAVRELVDSDPVAVESVLNGVLDSAGHRLDVWYTAIAHRRLRQLQALRATPVLGAYGWVDDLRPADDPTPPTTAGLLHAPGYPQALTAALLRDHAVHDTDDERWKLTLDSATVRLASELADQVRSGTHLSEVLGREIERRFPAPGRVMSLRRQYAARPEWEGRRVCDGQLVLDDARNHPDRLPGWLDRKQLRDLLDAIDAYADMLVADALHAVVEGRTDAAADALEASAGLGAPPELRLLRTQREGATVQTDVLFAIPWQKSWESTTITASTSPVTVADPAFARWLTRELGRTSAVTWTDRDRPARHVSLSRLHLTLADTLMYSADALDDLARSRLDHAGRLGGTAHETLAQVTRLASLLGARTPEGALAEQQLRSRLGRLRAMAKDLAQDLASPPPPGPKRRRLIERTRRWGLPVDIASARVELAQRRKIGTGDAKAPAEEVARRIRQLVPTLAPLPLVCPRTLPQVFGHREVLTDWLPVMAAVRPPMAKLEAAALLSDQQWASATSDRRDDPWAAPEPDRHGVSTDQHLTVVVGPGLGTRPGRPVGVVPLDAWGETVPAPRHTSWTAFGYDAPRARAPQAVLVVVPADTESPLDLAQVRGAVLKARQLARVRSSTGQTPDGVLVGLPLGVVEAVGDAAATLTQEEP